MPVSMDALADDLAAESAALRELLAPLEESDWRRATPAAGWSIGDQDHVELICFSCGEIRRYGPAGEVKNDLSADARKRLSSSGVKSPNGAPTTAVDDCMAPASAAPVSPSETPAELAALAIA